MKKNMQASNDTQTGEAFSAGRRKVLIGAGALGLGALAAAATGSGMPEAFAAGMHHHGKKNQAMTDAVNNCVKTGNACTAHCLDLIKAGDTSIIDCLRSVQETVAFCGGHTYLSAADSKHLDAMCELAIKICGDCQKECEKHAKKHAECKACGEACGACVKECKAHLKA